MRFLMIAGVLALSVAAGAAQAQSNPNYAPCSVCHSIKAGENRLGPTLFGLVGRKKASVPGFNYSLAMKAQRGVWTAAGLDAFLANPRSAVPGTRMMFPGLSDTKKRAALVAYLRTLH